MESIVFPNLNCSFNLVLSFLFSHKAKKSQFLIEERRIHIRGRACWENKYLIKYLHVLPKRLGCYFKNRVRSSSCHLLSKNKIQKKGREKNQREVDEKIDKNYSSTNNRVSLNDWKNKELTNTEWINSQLKRGEDEIGRNLVLFSYIYIKMEGKNSKLWVGCYNFTSHSWQLYLPFWYLKAFYSMYNRSLAGQTSTYFHLFRERLHHQQLIQLHLAPVTGRQQLPLLSFSFKKGPLGN